LEIKWDSFLIELSFFCPFPCCDKKTQAHNFTFRTMNKNSRGSIFKRTTEERRNDKRFSRILIGLMIAWAIYFRFLRPQTIGHDVRLNICVFFAPLVLGIFLIGYYRRNHWLEKFRQEEGVLNKTLIAGWYLFQGMLFSFFQHLFPGKCYMEYCQ